MLTRINLVIMLAMNFQKLNLLLRARTFGKNVFLDGLDLDIDETCLLSNMVSDKQCPNIESRAKSLRRKYDEIYHEFESLCISNRPEPKVAHRALYNVLLPIYDSTFPLRVVSPFAPCSTPRQATYRSTLLRNSSVNASFYIDSGDCNNICEFCGAFFWYDERAVAASGNERPKYMQCCKGGRVVLSFHTHFPTAIVDLFQQPHFLLNIRAYNSMFSMCSFGGKVDDTVNKGSGPYVFKIAGQIHHWIGSLCPPPNDRPRFLQMYIYDTDNEIDNRLHAFTSENQTPLDRETVIILQNTLETSNELIKLFRIARDICSMPDAPNFNVCLYSSETALRYDRPSPGCIGAIVSDDDPTCSTFDIIIRQKEGSPQRINKLHPLYMALQYPLLFIYGETGWSPKLTLRGNNNSQSKNMTINAYYSYMLHDRFNLYTLLLRAGRLLQQYLVDAYVCIEESRLDYIRQNQNIFRTEFLQGVHDAVQRGDTEGRDIGKRTILPSSFVGGPRYMYKHYQDALAICRVYGNPQYFITFTCNVKWPEIQRYLSRFPLLKPHDRPDIIARIFEIKVQSLIDFLKNKRPFGQVAAHLYTIEFQKRGLPHCHLLLWMGYSK
ncbi:hypothetical protein L2E82_27291 [Cichorium intybus]|uniref:Uncharacterized protein n=1 Tax=Cichorium intybus TaxID=13427 RepID=A0ACB9CSJ5_CICIN|nr:hypothetical protein L2E82_27291 [Cichorium intybus]